MASSQKKKNVAALHASAARRGLSPLLEISSKSESEIGTQLSAFALRTRANGRETSVESAFQGSKVFEKGGPFQDLYSADSREAKKDARLRDSGRLKCFMFENEEYPLSPTTAFYDWLYINALYRHAEWRKYLQSFSGFTDIEFNPERSLNCQARSCAIFVALEGRDIIDDALQSFGSFKDILETSGI
jgi:hypothetical protein